MAFSYVPEMLETEPIHQVRLVLGDTVEKDAHLQDEEISFFLTDNNDDIDSAIAVSAEAIANRYSHEASYTVGPQQVQLGSRARTFQEIADKYYTRARARRAGVPQPMASGEKGYFYEGMHSQPSSDLP